MESQSGSSLVALFIRAVNDDLAVKGTPSSPVRPADWYDPGVFGQVQRQLFPGPLAVPSATDDALVAHRDETADRHARTAVALTEAAWRMPLSDPRCDVASAEREALNKQLASLRHAARDACGIVDELSEAELSARFESTAPVLERRRVHSEIAAGPTMHLWSGLTD